jgi:two-component system, LuxR family, sensor kinase FixL
MSIERSASYLAAVHELLGSGPLAAVPAWVTQDAFSRALIEGMNEGIVVRDADGRIVYASPQFRQMLGYEPNQLAELGESLIAPSERARWQRTLSQARSGHDQRFEHDLLCKDGRTISVMVSRRPLIDAEGEFRGTVALVSDITEARHSSRQLQQFAEITAPLVGTQFFQAAARFLSDALGVSTVLFAECANYPTTKMHTLGYWRHGQQLDDVVFELAGAPCEETVGSGKPYCCFTGVAARFAAKRNTGYEGYLGMPFIEPGGGRVIGHMALFDSEPVDARLAEHPLLRIVFSRAEAEINRKHADDHLQLVASATAPLAGEDFFRTLIEHLVSTFGFRQAFVTECLDVPPTRVRTVAYWDGTAIRDNMEFALAGLPCAVTVGEARPHFVAEGLDQLYPAETGSGRVSYFGLPIFDADRRVVGHLAFFDDKPRRSPVFDSPVFRILASRAGVELLRKRAEERLQRSEAEYRLLVESQTDLIVKLDRTGRYQFVNPSFCACFGKTEQQLLGQPFDLETSPLDREPFEESYSAVLEPPHRSRAEARFLTASGWRWLAWDCAAILDETGSVIEILAAGRDVTDRKRAEEQARQHLQQLAHVTRLSSMGEMASAIAHELNQPLTAIVTFNQACIRLLRTASAPLEEIVGTMERVAGEAARASQIIRHLRSFVAKHDADHIPVQLSFLVEEVVRLVQPEARQSAISIRTELADQLPAVLADHIQIEQVLLNLMRNSIDAINGHHGQLREILISTRLGADGMVEASVQDSGAGFDPQLAEQLFEPFFTTKPQGMGVGLSISRSIIEAHGGRIRADRLPGQGTCFSLSLPPAAAPATKVAG